MLEGTTFHEDLQATEPEVHLALTRAGVTGVQKVIRIAHGGTELLYYADIDCYVDLDPAQKGVHMSRFPETVAEAIDQVVIGESLHVEDLAQHIAERVVERQAAVRSEVTIRAKFPDTGVVRVTGNFARMVTSERTAACRSTTSSAMCCARSSTCSDSPMTT